MYNAHWIHSLPYSKFIELTLPLLLILEFQQVDTELAVLQTFKNGNTASRQKYCREAATDAPSHRDEACRVSCQVVALRLLSGGCAWTFVGLKRQLSILKFAIFEK